MLEKGDEIAVARHSGMAEPTHRLVENLPDRILQSTLLLDLAHDRERGTIRDQSAHWTLSRSSRGATPPEMLVSASVPVSMKGQRLWRFKDTAILPLAEIDMRAAPGRSKSLLGSGWSVRVEKVSMGFPSHSAV